MERFNFLCGWSSLYDNSTLCDTPTLHADTFTLHVDTLT